MIISGFFFLFIFILSVVVQADEMLVIQSGGQLASWDKGHNKALKKILGKRHRIHVLKMEMEEADKKALSVKAEEIWKKYKRLKPKHIILADDEAIGLLGKRFAKEDVSVVFLGANGNPRSRFGTNGFPHNVTGVLERPLIRKSIFSLSQLIPSTKKVLVLFDKSADSNAALDQISYRTKKINNVRVDIKQVTYSRAWKSEIIDAEENGYDAIFIGYYHGLKDKEDVVVAPEDVITWSNQNTTIPLFAYWDNSVGKGKATGGLLVNNYEQGVSAAKLLLQAAEGRIPNSVICSRGQLVFSRSELKRWDIDLPKSILLQAKLVN